MEFQEKQSHVGQQINMHEMGHVDNINTEKRVNSWKKYPKSI